MLLLVSFLSPANHAAHIGHRQLAANELNGFRSAAFHAIAAPLLLAIQQDKKVEPTSDNTVEDNFPHREHLVWEIANEIGNDNFAFHQNTIHGILRDFRDILHVLDKPRRLLIKLSFWRYSFDLTSIGIAVGTKTEIVVVDRALEEVEAC